MNDAIIHTADHLEPWSALLGDGWPAAAGVVPNERAVQQALELGATPGTKVGMAWVMYCRTEGATRTEVTLVCGGPQMNAATDAARAAKLEFMARKRDDGATAYFLGPVGSHPGGPDARPIGRSANAQQQSLQAELEGILESYQSVRTSKPFGADQALWRAFEAVKADLERLACISSRPDLSVTWSVGKGNWARVPWLAVFSERETTSTQQGVYCAFLFREDMTGVYLALNQGVTEPKNRLGPQAGLEEVELRADDLRTTSRHLEAHGFDFEESLDLRTGPGRGQDYQRSTIIHKLYERGRVPNDEAIASDLEALLNVYDGYLARKFQADGNQHRLEEMKLRFLERMPSFESFPASGPESDYGQQERNYKDELVQIFREEIEPRLKSDAGDLDDENRLAADVHGLLRRQLSSIGQPQNLLTWRDYDFLNRIDDEKKRQFVSMLRDLLYGSGRTGNRIERFVENFIDILENTTRKVIPAWTRIVPSFFLMFAYPETEIFVKTTQFNKAAKMSLDLPSLANRSFDTEQYGQVMRVAAVIREALEEWGWEPRDMIDVQSFIWVATSVPNDEDSEAVPAENDDDDKSDVDREIVGNAYTEPPFDEIRHSVEEEGLRLPERLLRRYHLAIKSRGFVILSGISGTGKTWLAQAYARAVSAEHLLVPVAPNWTTNEDLLGFLNPLDGIYHHTQFSRFLNRAASVYVEAERQGIEARPFHLILDEMNLARVEYYFAKFLSSMELRASGRRAVVELAPDQRVELTPNLSFVGTVNIDETTHGFSDKVYDRAQLIELDGPRELLVEHLGQEPYADALMEVWDAVEETAPFAFRVLDEVSAYTSSATSMGVAWEQALDEQLLQKVLPKLKGSDPRVGDALESIVRLSQDKFQLTHQKAQLMLDRFRRHGFTSYF